MFICILGLFFEFSIKVAAPQYIEFIGFHRKTSIHRICRICRYFNMTNQFRHLRDEKKKLVNTDLMLRFEFTIHLINTTRVWVREPQNTYMKNRNDHKIRIYLRGKNLNSFFFVSSIVLFRISTSCQMCNREN